MPKGKIRSLGRGLFGGGADTSGVQACYLLNNQILVGWWEADNPEQRLKVFTLPTVEAVRTALARFQEIEDTPLITEDEIVAIIMEALL